jgi:Kef-type K+ transport system membrane component KefB
VTGGGDLLFHAALAWLVVVACGRTLGRAAAAAGQPPVIGEVLSGILLGPSLLGTVWPAAEAYLFPADTRPVLAAVAQVGVVLYMFLVGLEFDTALLRRRAGAVLVTAQAAVAIPFVLGSCLAAALPYGLMPAAASRASFVLFMGVAMALTAFPVLARILTDRRLARTELGIAALTCAAINDVVAWVLLAIVVGVTRAMPTSGVPGELVIAFAAGAAIPSGSAFALAVTRRLSAVVSVLLLPAFFALTGLRTQIALVSSASDWMICAAIIAVATVSKIGGTAVAGRVAGMPGRFALRLGTLMNARGLMELIVLAVGLDAGIITPALFTMMVIMAIVTTAMTGPFLDLIPAAKDEERPR